MKKIKQRTKTSNLVADWPQNKGKFLVWSKYMFAYINFAVYPSLLEPQQSNLSNPEAQLEAYQTCKMECFAEIVNG